MHIFSQYVIFYQPKTKKQVYEQPVEMLRNDEYSTGNSLVYLHNENYYKHFSTNLSRQKYTSIPPQNNFI